VNEPVCMVVLCSPSCWMLASFHHFTVVSLSHLSETVPAVEPHHTTHCGCMVAEGTGREGRGLPQPTAQHVKGCEESQIASFLGLLCAAAASALRFARNASSLDVENRTCRGLDEVDKGETATQS
jgi:hypothetical protein